ncbi:MAG: shikimate dehydrogenase [Bacteroidia bacterium]|nr:shikimate dehydrogenase [Bacteroidia bacterium]
MRTFGLIGFPLSHTFSPSYFAEKFKRERIQNTVYTAYPLQNIADLPALLLKESSLEGFNVTIPYKEKIIPLLDEIHGEAKETGAVNTVRVIRSSNGIRLAGYNTDVFGFRQSLKPFLESRHQPALILGTGGASKSVQYVLKQLGISYKCVSRSSMPGCLSYESLAPETIRMCKLIIHCTPAGMYPNVNEEPPLPENWSDAVGSDHFLYDLIYNPPETLFLKRGREKKALTMNGLSMLQQQAEETWRIFSENYPIR